MQDTIESAARARTTPSGVEALRARMEHERRRFLSAIERPAETRAEVLRSCIERNAQTVFGREHGFEHIRALGDFTKAVPIRRYGDLAPYIERAARGESGILTDSPPIAFLRSSGTTGGDAKKLPVTREFFRECFLPSYFASLDPLVASCPDALLRDDATLNAKWDPNAPVDQVESGVGHLGASQLDASRMGDALASEPGTRAPWARLPVEVTDHVEREYLRVRLAVESDVRLVIGINPAMVASLHDQLVGSWARIIDELRRGGAGCHMSRTPNPVRADALERAADRAGTISPAIVWPNLSTIFCWTSGSSRLYLPWIARRFGENARLFSAPSGSSEAPVALPVDGRPFCGGALAVHAAFHEFVPADRPLEPDSETCALEDLEVGGLYHVVVTQSGGLYRYAVGDVVRVVGFRGRTPLVDWAGRDPGARTPVRPVSDWEAVAAVERASTTVLGPGLVTAFALGDAERGPLRAVIETRRVLSPAEVERLAVELDCALSSESRAYRRARSLSGLHELVVTHVPGGTFAADRRRRIRAGVPPTRVKDKPLLDTNELASLLDAHRVRPEAT